MNRGTIALRAEMIVLSVMRLPLIVGFLVSAALVIRVPFNDGAASATPPLRSGARDLTPGAGEPRQSPPADSRPELPGRLTTQRQTQGEFCLSNLATTAGDIRYVVNGDSYVLGPGQSHRFFFGSACHVQFHRGAEFGYAEHVLPPGTYSFQVGSQGWDLVDARTGRPIRP